MSETAVKPRRRHMGQGLKVATEVGPLGVFFLVNSQSHNIFGNAEPQNIFWATGAFMIAIAISLAVAISIERRPPVMPLVSGVLVLIMGGLTLYLHDELFIKLKPTIVNSMFAAALLAGLAFGQLFLKYIFGAAFSLSDKGWRVLTWRWAGFFVFLAIVNEIVWRSFSTDFWVSFKVFGIMPITIAFALWQMRVVYRYQKEPETGEKSVEGSRSGS
ncbi:MAG: septation protein A [Rhizobiales bacterium NRL2]|jgi:intracellular septation protein|nr:MAG: septation protein A [Rhizobiales bacterium NRL2]